MELQEVFRRRRTVRRFEQRMPEKETIQEILDLVRLTPCAANRQQLRYTVLQEPVLTEKIFRLCAWAGFVTPRRTPEWGKTAPRLFVAVTAPETPQGPIEADAGAAIQTLLCAAWERGLGGCWIGAFDKKQASALLGKNVLYLVALGYPAETPRSEDIAADGDLRYYLDDADQLHVPKIRCADLVEWR